MIRSQTAAFNISNNDLIVFYQFLNNNDDATIEEIYILKMGDFSLQLMEDKIDIHETFKTNAYDGGVSIINNSNMEQSYYLGFVTVVDAIIFLQLFTKSLENKLMGF